MKDNCFHVPAEWPVFEYGIIYQGPQQEEGTIVISGCRWKLMDPKWGDKKLRNIPPRPEKWIANNLAGIVVDEAKSQCFDVRDRRDEKSSSKKTSIS
jgi:hypothetical protein